MSHDRPCQRGLNVNNEENIEEGENELCSLQTTVYVICSFISEPSLCILPVIIGLRVSCQCRLVEKHRLVVIGMSKSSCLSVYDSDSFT